MSAKLLDGKHVATILQQNIQNLIKQRTTNRAPTLAVVLVGNDPASKIYTDRKKSVCKEIGINTISVEMNSDATLSKIKQKIVELNSNNNVDGILVQLPLPDRTHELEVINTISPTKDVDGFCLANIGALHSESPRFIPCTPYGIMQLLDHYNLKVSKKKVTVIGTSLVVGKPMIECFIQTGGTVTACNMNTQNLKEHTSCADILVAAAGSPGLVKGDMIKPGAIVIDVGINRVKNKIIGDVVFSEATKVASYITPVPGGIGPMTVASLMQNTYQAYSDNLLRN